MLRRWLSTAPAAAKTRPLTPAQAVLQAPPRVSSLPDITWDHLTPPVIKCVLRHNRYRRHAHFLRTKYHLVPGVIFPPRDQIKGKQLVAFPRSQVDHLPVKMWYLHKVYEVQVFKDFAHMEDPDAEPLKKELVLGQKVQKVYSKEPKPLSLSFMKFYPNKAYKFDIPILFDFEKDNETARFGGYLDIILEKLPCVWKGDHRIPEALYVDVADMKIGQKIYIKDLKLPKNLQLNKYIVDPDQPICSWNLPKDSWYGKTSETEIAEMRRKSAAALAAEKEKEKQKALQKQQQAAEKKKKAEGDKS